MCSIVYFIVVHFLSSRIKLIDPICCLSSVHMAENWVSMDETDSFEVITKHVGTYESEL